MSEKVILFLSELRDDPREERFLCPDGRTVSGVQTNEAPVRYLLRRWPSVSEILCIVTPSARASAWARFADAIRRTAPAVALTEIPFAEEEDFSAAPLERILARFSPGDALLLETTGGLRNTVMYLLLLSRVLSYAGISTAGAVYANYARRKIEDVSGSFRLFDLVNGMQELTAFGSVQTLRKSYDGAQQDEKISALLTAAERLQEAILLCRTGSLDPLMKQFSAALTDAEGCSDSLMRQLLPAFQEKFGGKLDTPGLIRWCVRNNLLQQALTIYKEKLPEYLLREREDLVRIAPDAPPPENRKNYQNEWEARFDEHLLKLGRNLRTSYYGYDPDRTVSERQDYVVTTLEHLEELLPHSYFHVCCSVMRFRSFLMDYVYLRALRNMVNHANDERTESQAQVLRYLESQCYRPPESLTAQEVRVFLLHSLEKLKA